MLNAANEVAVDAFLHDRLHVYRHRPVSLRRAWTSTSCLEGRLVRAAGRRRRMGVVSRRAGDHRRSRF
ncbi:MAG: hypothetical protein ACLTSX_00090 [Collinsella sp.]